MTEQTKTINKAPRCFCKAEILWEPTLGNLVMLTSNGVKHSAERCGVETKGKK